MVILGAFLAIVTGLGFSSAALVQKHETLRTGVGPARLLGALVKRWRWLAATLLSVVAWVAHVAALTLAPIALVIPLVGAGTALLVVGGTRWLGERFGRMELVAVVMVAAGGAAAAVGASAVPVAHRALPFVTQLLLGGAALAAAGVAVVRRDGISLGIAAGCLYAGATQTGGDAVDRSARGHRVVHDPARGQHAVAGGARNLHGPAARRRNHRLDVERLPNHHHRHGSQATGAGDARQPGGAKGGGESGDGRGSGTANAKLLSSIRRDSGVSLRAIFIRSALPWVLPSG